MYIPVYTIFMSVCFLSGFPWYMVAEPRVPSGKVEVIVSNFSPSPSRKTWIIVTEYLFHRWPRIWSIIIIISSFFPC
jgi:hypothetical protein